LYGRVCLIRSLISVSAASAVLIGCAQVGPYRAPFPAPATPSPAPTATQSQTIDLEASDRIARFRRLAASLGQSPPEVDQLYAPAGTVPGVDASVPVVRLVFDERVFFDSDKATPRPESMSVIQLVAENMKRDVPDAALTVLGHTDAVGTDAYNIALSQRRASTVLTDLVELGLNPNQLSTVAIGKAQPIAPNSTPEGRARNRRVEFLISGSEAANLSVVQNRPIDANFLLLGPHQAPMRIAPVQVLKPRRKPTGEIYLGPAGILTLRPAEPGPAAVVPAAAETPHPNEPSPAPARRVVKPENPVVPRSPEPVLPAPLHDPSPDNF